MPFARQAAREPDSETGARQARGSRCFGISSRVRGGKPISRDTSRPRERAYSILSASTVQLLPEPSARSRSTASPTLRLIGRWFDRFSRTAPGNANHALDLLLAANHELRHRSQSPREPTSRSASVERNRRDRCSRASCPGKRSTGSIACWTGQSGKEQPGAGGRHPAPASHRVPQERNPPAALVGSPIDDSAGACRRQDGAPGSFALNSSGPKHILGTPAARRKPLRLFVAERSRHGPAGRRPRLLVPCPAARRASRTFAFTIFAIPICQPRGHERGARAGGRAPARAFRACARRCATPISGTGKSSWRPRGSDNRSEPLWGCEQLVEVSGS